MLNVFPDFLAFSFVAPFLLRLVLGLIFIDLGVLKFKGEKEQWMRSFDAFGLRPVDLLLPAYALLQIIGGVMLVVGLWTQVAALFFILATAFEFGVEWKMREVLKRDIVFYLLLLTLSISLFLTGAGAYAIDIPL